MVKKGFTAPKLHDCGGDLSKEWYVSFRFTDPETGQRKPFPHRMGINYLTTKTERYEEAKAIIAVLFDALQAGWNPFKQTIKEYKLSESLVEQQQVIDVARLDYSATPLNIALSLAYKSKSSTLAQKSRETYKGVKWFAQVAAVKLKIDTMPVSSVKRPHIKLLLEQMQKDREEEYERVYQEQMHNYLNPAGRWAWESRRKSKAPVKKQFTGNTYNKYKRFLHGLFTELEEFEAIEYNPCRIADRPEIDTNKHRHATAAEEVVIKRTIKERNIRLYVYMAIEELAGIRPKEIFGLRIIDIDWFNQAFDLQSTEELTKTRTARKVPIPNTLVPLLRLLDLEKYDPEHFIFSKKLEPGPYRLMRCDTATKLYRKIVKDELGIDVTMYSFKGLGGDKKIDAGIEKKTVSLQFGHTQMSTTDIYLERESERVRKSIIENTPGFD